MQLISSQFTQSETNEAVAYSLSVIVPVFNEQDVLVQFHQTLCAALAQLPNERVQIIYVNDGSSDGSWPIIESLRSASADIYRLNLSRNFGKEAAMTAGLDHAAGDAITVLDADLQDPPDLILPMLEKLREGYDVVNMQRRHRHGENLSKRFWAHQYHRLLRWLADSPVDSGVGDFRMLSRRVVDAIRQLPEKNRYMKGIMSWPGFRVTTLQFDRPGRAAGETKWSFFQLCSLALAGVTAFSIKPLRLATFAGLLISIAAFCFGGWVLTKTLLIGEPVAGYPSLMLVVLFIGGVQLLGIGIVGEYVGRVFIESKARPTYLLMDNSVVYAECSNMVYASKAKYG